MRKKTNRPLTVSVALLSAAFAASLVAQAHQAGSAVPDKADDRAVLHVLNRLGFGPTAADVERVKRMGISAYIEQQLHPERLPDGAMRERLAPFQTLNKSTRELSQDYFLPAMMMRRQQKRQQGAADPTRPPDDATRREMRTPEQIDAQRAERSVLAELAQQKVLRAAYSERQLEEVLVDFWFNHFNVFAGKGATRLYLTEYERDAIRPHVFGRFRELLGATAHSPAMLFYLDNWQSASERAEGMERPGRVQGRTMRGFGRTMPGRPRALEAQQNRRPRGLNENYARELLELHTLGVDGGYTQKDVRKLRVRSRAGRSTLRARAARSASSQACTTTGRKWCSVSESRPAVGRLMASRCSTSSPRTHRRHVSSPPSWRGDSSRTTPPAALVDRATARFRESRGDIREVVRTIVTSPEFFDPLRIAQR